MDLRKAFGPSTKRSLTPFSLPEALERIMALRSKSLINVHMRGSTVHNQNSPDRMELLFRKVRQIRSGLNNGEGASCVI